MVFPREIWLLLAMALLVSAIGFKKFLWFISLGYGFSIAAEGLLMLVLFRGSLTPGTALCCGILTLYGLRLGGYLALRESKSASYQKKMKGEITESSDVALWAKLATWGACALLYVLEVVPVLYRLCNGSGSGLWTYVGGAVMACGVALEAAADLQKSRAKRIDPKRFVDTGLYRLVRCPNYLGEIVLWTGTVLSGVGALRGAGQWGLALLGYGGILFVMFSGARRLELRQNKTYGDDPAYQRYVKTVPILLPLMPLYSVAKYEWLVA